MSHYNRQRYRPWLKRDRRGYQYDRYDSPTSSDTDTSMDYRSNRRSKYPTDKSSKSRRAKGRGRHSKGIKGHDWKRFGAAAVRNTGLAVCSVYPSLQQYIFFQDIYGQVRCMQWSQGTRAAVNRPNPGPGTLRASVDRDSTGGVLEEAANAKWGTPLAAVAQETKRPCCKASNVKEHVLYLFYLNPENFLRGLTCPGSGAEAAKWEPLLKLSQSLIHVHPNTKLAALSVAGQDGGRSVHIYYQGLDQRIRELTLEGDKFNETIVSQEPPVSGSHIGVCTIANGSTIMVFYQNQKNSIHACFKKSNRRWSPAAWKITNKLFFPQQPFTVVAEPNDFICTTKELRQSKLDPQAAKPEPEEEPKVREQEKKSSGKTGAAVNKTQGKTSTSQDPKPQEQKSRPGTMDMSEPLYRVAVQSETVHIFFNYQLRSGTKVPFVAETSFTLTPSSLKKSDPKSGPVGANGFNCVRKGKAHKGWPQSEIEAKIRPPMAKATPTEKYPEPEVNTYGVFPGATLAGLAWVTGDVPKEGDKVSIKRSIRVFIQRADCHFIHLETAVAMKGALVQHTKKLDVEELVRLVADLGVTDNGTARPPAEEPSGESEDDYDDYDDSDDPYDSDTSEGRWHRYQRRYRYNSATYSDLDDDTEGEDYENEDEDNEDEADDQNWDATEGGDLEETEETEETEGTGETEEAEETQETEFADEPADEPDDGKQKHAEKYNYEDQEENHFYDGPLFLTVDEGAHDDDEEVFTKRPTIAKQGRQRGGDAAGNNE